jgi:hypothetical protein
MQDIELEDLIEIGKRTVEGDHGKSGQVGIFKQVRLKGRQKLSGFDQWVFAMLKKGADKAIFGLDQIKKCLQTLDGVEMGAPALV